MFTTEPHYNYSAHPDETGISPSSLTTFRECPYYYWAKRVAKIWEDGNNDAFDIGSGADSLITIGRDHYESHFEVVSRRTESLREKAKADGCPTDCGDEKCDGITLLTPKNNETILSMVKELARQPLYRKFTGEGWENQVKVGSDFVDEFDNTSVYVRGKMDYFNEKYKIIADLKTCADLKTFKPTFYSMQLGLYHELVKKVYNIDCQVFVIAVDKTDMTRSRFFRYSEFTLDDGLKNALKLIEQLKACRESNAWGSQTYDKEKVHSCATYSACPYAIQDQVFTV